MSIEINENKKLIKLKEEILTQVKIEQKQYAENLEEKMEETNKLIFETNKKFEENKDFFKYILSQKYYLDKIENLDSKFSKINDSLLAHEIRISKNIDEINSIKIKYDKIILDNLLLPGQIGPSCKYKNLSQYLKNNINDMNKMKEDSENIKNLSKLLKVKYQSEAKNVTGLIDNFVIRSNQYTDNRINDCISIMEHKTKEIGEKIMDIRMKFIQKQENLEQNINSIKHHFEEKIKKQDEKIKELNSIILNINENLPNVENINENIDKIKNKLKNMKNLLINFINNFQELSNTNNNNNKSQVRYRRNSMMLGNDLSKIINDNSEEPISKGKKNFNENKLVDINPAKNKHRAKELLSPEHVRKGTVIPLKYKSNQKQSFKLQLINISENSSDNNDNNDESRNKKDKNNNEKKIKEINEKVNKIHTIIELKKDKNKSDRNSVKNKSRGNKNKMSIRNKIDENASKSNKKNNSLSDSFSSISDSSYSNYYYKEKDKDKEKEMDEKQESKYQNKKDNEKILIKSGTINNLKKKLFHLGNISQNSYNSLQNFNFETNNITNLKLKSTYQNLSRNLNNNKSIINNQSLNSNLNSQQLNFYRSQQEEKKEIIKDFFSKYDKNVIQNNLNLIKNRANLDLYNFSVSPPDNRHLLDMKQDEIYDPPLSKEFKLNKKNNQISKLGNLSNDKNYNHGNKMNFENSIKSNRNINKINNNNINYNNTNYNNKLIGNKKVENSSKFTNTYKNYFPDNKKKGKIYSMN